MLRLHCSIRAGMLAWRGVTCWSADVRRAVHAISVGLCRFQEARAKRPAMQLDYEFIDSPQVRSWRADVLAV